MLSPRQVGFRPGRSTLDQILFLFQSISDGFNKPRPGSRTILATIDFSKAFDSVWHSTLFYKLISAGPPPCIARWTQSFLSDRHACMVYLNHKSRFFRVRQGVLQESVPCLLPSAALFMLTIWPFGPPSSRSILEATLGALFQLEPWSEYWCLPLNPSKCEASFFSVDPHQDNLQPHLLLFNSRLRLNPTPTVLGVTFDHTLSFFKLASLLKAKVVLHLKTLRCIFAFSGTPSKEFYSLLYKAFLWPLLTYASPGWFPFLSVINITKLERLHLVASRTITGCLSSYLIPLLLSVASLPPLRVTLTHFSSFVL